MEPLETGAGAHDAPELTEALDVVVVGAAVVVVAAIAVLELDGSSDTAFVAEVELWAEEDDVAVVDVVAAADARAAVVVVAVVSAEPAASKVWPASSVRPMVASNEPPANQTVAARALRIPRRRLAPGKPLAEVGMANLR